MVATMAGSRGPSGECVGYPALEIVAAPPAHCRLTNYCTNWSQKGKNEAQDRFSGPIQNEGSVAKSFGVG